MGAVKSSLANAIGAMYVRKYFQENAKSAALEMVADIRHEFEKILQDIDWMDESTKDKARSKASAIVEHIGYPTELMDKQKLENLYKGLELSSDDFLGNALNMTVFGTNYAYSKLREEVSFGCNLYDLKKRTAFETFLWLVLYGFYA